MVRYLRSALNFKPQKQAPLRNVWEALGFAGADAKGPVSSGSGLQATSPRAAQPAGVAEPERPVRGRRRACTPCPSGANRQAFHVPPPEPPEEACQPPARGRAHPRAPRPPGGGGGGCRMPAPLRRSRSSRAWVRSSPAARGVTGLRLRKLGTPGSHQVDTREPGARRAPRPLLAAFPPPLRPSEAGRRVYLVDAPRAGRASWPYRGRGPQAPPQSRSHRTHPRATPPSAAVTVCKLGGREEEMEKEGKRERKTLKRMSKTWL